MQLGVRRAAVAADERDDPMVDRMNAIHAEDRCIATTYPPLVPTSEEAQGRVGRRTGLPSSAVRLLLPAHYETKKARRWPVLYLLHGCCDSYVSWTRSTDIEQLTQRSDLIVVMADGGKAGFYSGWQSGPGWETFHTTELPALLVRQYRQVPSLRWQGCQWEALALSATPPGTPECSPSQPP
jgi:Putative esterase